MKEIASCQIVEIEGESRFEDIERKLRDSSLRLSHDLDHGDIRDSASRLGTDKPTSSDDRSEYRFHWTMVFWNRSFDIGIESAAIPSYEQGHVVHPPIEAPADTLIVSVHSVRIRCDGHHGNGHGSSWPRILRGVEIARSVATKDSQPLADETSLYSHALPISSNDSIPTAVVRDTEHPKALFHIHMPSIFTWWNVAKGHFTPWLEKTIGRKCSFGSELSLGTPATMVHGVFS